MHARDGWRVLRRKNAELADFAETAAAEAERPGNLVPPATQRPLTCPHRPVDRRTLHRADPTTAPTSATKITTTGALVRLDEDRRCFLPSGLEQHLDLVVAPIDHRASGTAASTVRAGEVGTGHGPAR